MALPTTEKTLPFGGEVSFFIDLITNSELAIRMKEKFLQ